MAQIIKLDINELLNVSTEIGNIKNEIAGISSNLQNEIQELSYNVTGTDVNSLINTILDSTQKVSDKLSVSLDTLSVFLREQMKAYTVSLDEAEANFKKAISFIDGILTK